METIHTPPTEQEQKFFGTESYIIRIGATFYWMIYWVLNAVDKVAYNSTYWHGKDRVEKMAGYFGSINLTDSFYSIGSLVAAGIIELLAGLLFAVSLWLIIRKRDFSAYRLYFWGSFVSIVIFSGFAIFDVVFGDRAELLEHTTYWMAIIVSWMAYVYVARFSVKQG